MGFLTKFKSLLKKQSFRHNKTVPRGQTCCYSDLSSSSSSSSADTLVPKQRALKKPNISSEVKDIKHHLNNNWNHQNPQKNQQSFSGSHSGMVSKTVVVLMIGLLGMVYQATQQHPPPPEQQQEVVSPEDGGAGKESLRIRLKDGRYLAYREQGVSKDESKYKIIIVHGFGSSKEMNFLAPQELIEELGIYFLLFDRAGYGGSDSHPKRTVKSEALDLEEISDQLELGPKFYVIGVSMGSYPIWSCLKYIPDRLAGAALINPVVNYKWPSLPKNLIKDDYRRKLVQWALWFSKYAPGLLHWWVTQQWLPSTSVLEKNPFFFSTQDIEILKKIPGFPMLSKENLQEQEVFDTLRHDFMVSFDKWDFDPIQLENPFPQNESSRVHIWQGYEDKVVPYQLQRFISGKLPWIQYHEVPHGGHLVVHYNGLCEAVLRSLLLGEEPLKLENVLP